MNWKKRFYGNIQIYSPDDILLCKSNLGKVEWYLNRDLAKILKTENDKILSIKLNFKPNGLGWNNYDKFDKNNQTYFLSEKKNICVVSGEDDLTKLTKHHVVPTMYRKWFPDEYKSHNCFDIVLIDKDLHIYYEKIAMDLKNKISNDLGILNQKDYLRKITKNSYIGMAKYILSKTIDMEQKILLCIKFNKKTGIVPTSENLNMYIKYTKDKHREAELYGKYVIENITDYVGFVRMWRQHFLDVMKPKFMPTGWNVENDIWICT